MYQIVISPMDRIAERYGERLASLGSPAKTHKVIARAVNYEGRKAFVQVKRAVRVQSSIPTPIVQKSMIFIPASTKGGAIEASIKGSGHELSLKLFGARQFKIGTRAKVWGRNQMFEGAFRGARPGMITEKLGGHVYIRVSKDRLPIKKLWGPSVPREMVKDQSRSAFYASVPKILDRVGKEIAAVVRGF